MGTKVKVMEKWPWKFRLTSISDWFLVVLLISLQMKISLAMKDSHQRRGNERNEQSLLSPYLILVKLLVVTRHCDLHCNHLLTWVLMWPNISMTTLMLTLLGWLCHVDLSVVLQCTGVPYIWQILTGITEMHLSGQSSLGSVLLLCLLLMYKVDVPSPAIRSCSLRFS